MVEDVHVCVGCLVGWLSSVSQHNEASAGSDRLTDNHWLVKGGNMSVISVFDFSLTGWECVGGIKFF